MGSALWERVSPKRELALYCRREERVTVCRDRAGRCRTEDFQEMRQFLP